MPTVKSFRALRFTEKAGELKNLIAPPYDVIKNTRECLVANSQYNIANITLPEGELTEENNKYENAKDIINSWIGGGILAQDEAPSMSVVRENYTVEGTDYQRTGVELLVKLDDAEDNAVYPHERTLSGPKADRLSLMKATDTQLGVVFMLVPDEDGELRKTLTAITEATDSQATKDITCVDDATRSIWTTTDNSLTDKVSEILRGRPAIIADGHHRFETAKAFSQHKNATEDDYAGYVLTHIVPLGDPGLVVFPLHRVISLQGRKSFAEIATELETNFELKEITQEEAVEFTSNAPQLTDSRAFVMSSNNKFLLATLKNAETYTSRLEGSSKEYKALDVPFLHSMIIEGVLNISPDEQAAGEVTYRKSYTEFFGEIQGGENIGLMLRPTSPESVCAVASAGEVMPQKATYFFPKVYTGLTMNYCG